MSELDAALGELATLGVQVDAEAFKKAKGRTLSASLKLRDLALAWACAQHDSAAIALFEKTVFPQAARALKKMKLSQTLTDDVLGWMRFELFARPKGLLISTYTGRGDLGGWVRSIAVHEGLKRVRAQRREVSPDEAAELPMPEVELASMRGAYGPQFTRALADSFAELTTAQRNLLRQYFLDGLGIDALAKLLAVHRATAARRVATAREELVAKVKTRLTRELELSRDGIDAIVTLSNLDESLGGILRKTRR